MIRIMSLTNIFDGFKRRLSPGHKADQMPGMNSSSTEEGGASKKQRLEGARIFIVRWAAHGSKVDEWDHEELEQIETCGDDIEEAKAYITGETNIGGTAMLLADGLRKDDEVYGKAFATIEQAREGMRECRAAQVRVRKK